MRRSISVLALLLMLVFANHMYGFEEIFFQNALKLDSRRSGRAVEKMIILNQWESPVEGDEIIVSDSVKLSWTSMKSDENGWFKGEDFRRAVLYFSLDIEEEGTYLLHGMGHSSVYVNGVPRNGNPYQYKEEYEDWEAKFDYSLVPVFLKKGRNEFLFMCNRGLFKGVLKKSEKQALFNFKDFTQPDFLIGEEINGYAALPIMNNTHQDLKNLTVEFEMDGMKKITQIDLIHRNSIVKIPFEIAGKKETKSGKKTGTIQLLNEKNEILDNGEIVFQIKSKTESYRKTFISSIDNSLQYYAVTPPIGPLKEPLALILSLHGASVEAINQAGSYYGKNWGVIVCPTNRRPYGFNWEDIGRLDALEVLSLAKEKFSVDPERIYLTGHSMGGHGTWHLGVTNPDLFAAIAPSAGWISFWSYRSRMGIEEDEKTDMENMFQRATLQSWTDDFSRNLKDLGVYILHGNDDKVVSDKEAFLMMDSLKLFHKDFVYHGEPEAGHWWDHNEEAKGTDCVDWPPMFDFFARHALPGKERTRLVEFSTANPAITSVYRWLKVVAQEKQLIKSHVQFRFDPGIRKFTGTTENVQEMAFDLTVLEGDEPVICSVDSQELELKKQPEEKWAYISKQDGKWNNMSQIDYSRKNPCRYGTLKEIFRNQVVFVYGTKGSVEENEWAFSKARFDAEHLWYQGNGSGKILPDTLYELEKYKDRNALLYGNEETNTAWNQVFGDCPVSVSNGKAVIGDKTFEGDKYSCIFIYPLKGSKIANAAAVSGTGINGFKLSYAAPYLTPGVGFPDFIIADEKLLIDEAEGIKGAGFFGLDWSYKNGDFVWNE